jgi:mannosyltransferase
VIPRSGRPAVTTETVSTGQSDVPTAEWPALGHVQSRVWPGHSGHAPASEGTAELPQLGPDQTPTLVIARTVHRPPDPDSAAEPAPDDAPTLVISGTVERPVAQSTHGNATTTTQLSTENAPTALMDRVRADLAATDPWGHHTSTAAFHGRNVEGRRQRVAAWLLPSLAMALIGGLGLSRPALWTDELATWGMAEVSWDRMWGVLRYVDAVLAPYYLLVRGATEVAGASDLVLRLPSLAAMVVTAGLLGSLGRRLGGSRLGVLAGLLFAVLPAASRFAQEARPYAMTAMFATLATYLLVLIWDRPTFWRLAGYALAIGCLGSMHVIALLLLVAHAWIVFAWHRRVVVHWAAAATLGVLPLLPLLRVGRAQSGQVAYIPRVSMDSAGPYAAGVIGSVALLVILVLLGLFGLPLRRPAGLFTAWVVLPVAGLIVVSQAFPLFLPRYLIFCLPGWALLGAAALARVRPAIAAGVLVVVAAVGLPAQLAMRQSDGHDEATRDAAAVITEGSRPGDAIVYAQNEPRGGWTTRDLVAHYVPAGRRPTDPLMVRRPRTEDQLLAGECPDVARCLGHPSRVWVIRMGSRTDPLAGIGTEKERVLRTAYTVEHVWRLRNVTVAILTRGTRR